jgi:hypothetical protein
MAPASWYEQRLAELRTWTDKPAAAEAELAAEMAPEVKRWLAELRRDWANPAAAAEDDRPGAPHTAPDGPAGEG